MCCSKGQTEASRAVQDGPVDVDIEKRRKPCCAGCAKKQASAETRHSDRLRDVPEIVYRTLYTPGRPLERHVRQAMETQLHADLGDIRIHVDSQAADSAQAIGALAYSFGQHIVFGPGLYLPEEPTGRRILVHELAHCLQQRLSWNRRETWPERMFESAYESFEAEAEALALAAAGRPQLSGGLPRRVSESPLQLACLGANPDCTTGQSQLIHQSIFNANAWVNNALRKLTATPTPASVVSSLRRNFGSTYGVTANLQLMINRLRFAKSVMNRIPIGCNSTDQVCVDGHCGFSTAGGMTATICTATLAAGVGAVFQARCVLHESFHAAFTRFTVDHYSSGHGTSTADADYPGAGIDPLLNADSYTTLVMDLS